MQNAFTCITKDPKGKGVFALHEKSKSIVFVSRDGTSVERVVRATNDDVTEPKLLAVDPEGNVLYLASDDGKIRIFDLVFTGKLEDAEEQKEDETYSIVNKSNNY